jgi:hypothetical protein
MENQQLVFALRQCSSTPVVLVTDLLAKNAITQKQHPPYFHNLAAVDFYLFPRLKSALKGQRFYDATDVKNATVELKMLS